MLRGSRFSRHGGDLKTPFLAGKERELLESKKWPACFSQSVDITKVQIDAFKPWITRRVTELMGVEDEIVVDYCLSQLKFFGETDAKANAENAGDGGKCLNEKPYLDPKKLQINLTGFMAKNARIFVKELWDLLLAAQDSEYGIPQAFIDEKKREIAAIQGAANEVEDTLRQMGSSLPAPDHAGSDANASAEGPIQIKNEPTPVENASVEAESVPGESRGARRQTSRSRREYGTQRYEARKYANSPARKYPIRRSDDSTRKRGSGDGGYRRRRRSPSSNSSRSSSASVRYRRRVHRERSPSRSSSGSYSNRSESSSSRSSPAVRRAPRHGRRRSYSSASTDSPTPSASSESRSSRSVESPVSRRGRGRRYEARRSRDRSVSHRRRGSSPKRRRRSSSSSSLSSRSSASSSQSYKTRRRHGGKRYGSRDRRSYS
ncbi:pwi domain-containing protein [Babesia ovata]|uniref:Pwi domain-containing protein n=1 Tax=Babesia ovata TaxID=189622 RepID=A0A2H6K7R0_9APIC|nr:pwi domain-containing protein [Babesia ovata]GBE59025.1 pwi domain-containing protein [Babesia ovata]